MAEGIVTALEAQHRVLGVSLQQLGSAVGRHWNFPDAITFSMKKLPAGKLRRPASDEEQLCQLSGFASEVTDRLAGGDQPGDRGLAELQLRYRLCVQFSGTRFDDILQNTRSEYRRLAEGLATADGAPPAIRALAGLQREDVHAVPADDIADIALPEDDSAVPALHVGDPEPVPLDGLQEATAMLAEGAALNQVAQVMLETLYRALDLRRVALCLRDIAARQYVGRLGFGGDVDAYLRALRFGEAYERDVFHVALQQKTDVHIADLAVAGAGHGIPSWYHAHSPSGALLFLPLVVQERPVGCIIAEHAMRHGLQLGPGTLRLVRALRNQLALGLQLRRATRA
jgi:hypothetical protein